jgi:Spy/CpxP family protein refolding chaperone
MKRTLIPVALLSAFFAMPASAQPRNDVGHGMMGGGMMGGGMMGGGMMGGPGMMGDQGPGRAGDCHSGYAALNLTDEQRAKLGDIRRDLWRKRQEVMSRMHEQDIHMHDVFALGSVDENKARKAFDAMTVAHKEMFEASLDAGKRMNAVLTPEQREQLQRARRGS